jgi:hypothetical protein
MEVEIMCGEDWERSSDISTVPVEHWEWFLGARVGSKSMAQVRWNAKKLLTNLRILRDNKGWKHLGLDTWEDALNWFDLTPQKWAWLEAGEPVLTDADSASQGIEKGRSEMARRLKAENPELGPTAIGRMVGCDKTTVRDALAVGEIVPLEEVPPRISHPRDQADFRKLSPEGQERVRQKEPLNRVAIAEGVRQPPDHLKLAKSHFLKMTAEQRTAFDEWRSGL